MQLMDYNTDDPIAALATPWSASALAVVRTSGPDSIEKIATVFSRPDELIRAAGNTVLHGTLLGKDGSVIDEVIVAVYRAPRSYTGQDSVEVICHGSLPGIEAVIELLRSIGFRDAAPGEFTLRAFLSGKMDLTKAEAVREIIESKSRKAHVLAFHRLSGAIEKRINAVKSKLLDMMSIIELQLDYPEDEIEESATLNPKDIESLRGDLHELAASYKTGRIYQEGVRVAIAGRTNAGKSSLFNLFLRQDRSIVSEIHGTTRDYVESWISLAGIPVSLIDTAGLRESEDLLESEGIRRSHAIIENAEQVIYLVDSREGVSSYDKNFLYGPDFGSRCIPVWNKIDISKESCPQGFLPLSCVSGQGFENLEIALIDRIQGKDTGVFEAIVDSARQKELLDRCIAALDHVLAGIASGVPVDAIASDFHEALQALGEITGEVTTVDILEQIFSRFCVGK